MAIELLVDEAEYRKALGKYDTELGKDQKYQRIEQLNKPERIGFEW